MTQTEISAFASNFHTAYEELLHFLVPKAWEAFTTNMSGCTNLFYIGEELYTTFEVPPRTESEMRDYIVTLRPDQLIALANLL